MVIASSLFAIAQQPPTVRVRGTIEAVDGARQSDHALMIGWPMAAME